MCPKENLFSSPVFFEVVDEVVVLLPVSKVLDDRSAYTAERAR
jgi:hypothetical protein